MNYPLISEYIEAIKHSEDNFNVLSTLRPVYDEAGEIVMSSGNFAVVFKMKDESSGKLYAVKMNWNMCHQTICAPSSTSKKNCLLILQFLLIQNFLYYSWTG